MDSASITDDLTERDDEPADDGSGGAFEHLITVDDPDHPQRNLTNIASWVIVGITCAVIAATLHPEWILRNTTATGGDMGAHVWGPAFLRDHLLPSLRLSGWSPDWYAGFPAYVFYMVVPSLMIVILNVGPPLWLAPFAVAAVAFGTWWLQQRITSPVLRTFVWICAGFLVALSIPIPYNIAFKMVTVSGLVTMPLAGYALARSAKLPFPGPPLVAIGAAVFLYETGFTIYGGNIPSTMAGEFAFSISLTFTVLYLAVLIKGSRTGRDRALGAVLFALVITCHLIPAIFAAIATVVYLFTRREDRTPWWDQHRAGRIVAGSALVIVVLTLWLIPSAFPIVGTLVVGALFVSFDQRVLKWAAIVGPVGFLVAAFWFVPFYLNSTYLNDMGWEKLTEYSKYLWPDPTVFDMPYRNIVFALAALGVVLSLVHRVRLGWWLTLTTVSMAWIFVLLPQYRLWNARILPFYILGLYLLAALSVALIVRSLALVVGDLRRMDHEPVSVSLGGLIAVFLVVLIALGGALRALPGGSVVSDPAVTGGSTYRWLGIDFPKQNISGGWALYNYMGLEQREAFPEFDGIMSTMRDVGAREGCGRAMWEYEPKLDRFGTPMALMLLPHFTDGCIGSMEGLYFEASSTTPFHFLTQSELSQQPSRAQRDLPYGNFDISQGVSHLQMMGVKYYMATSDAAVTAARTDPRLTEVASFSSPAPAGGVQHNWVVFEVADSQIVAPLANEPVVPEQIDDHVDGWIYGERPAPAQGQAQAPKSTGPAVAWYLDPLRWDVPLASSGPSSWQRVPLNDADPPRTPLPGVQIDDIQSDTNSISFSVDRVGAPVLVKASYFPNWKVSGAEGPYRVSPNQMVVIPTEQNVTLTYGSTWIDFLAWFLTISGLIIVGILAVDDQRRRDLELAGAHGGAAVAAGSQADEDSDEDADRDADGDREPALVGAGASDADADAGTDVDDSDVDRAADDDAEGDVERDADAVGADSVDGGADDAPDDASDDGTAPR
jgi:hypothetical protein